MLGWQRSAGSKRDPSRERSIMERVESLSQMYLGGLEEVRSDLYSVKRSCRDRINAIEAQWSDLQKQQELMDKGETSTPCSGQLRKCMLELDRFRYVHTSSVVWQRVYQYNYLF